MRSLAAFLLFVSACNAASASSVFNGTLNVLAGRAHIIPITVASVAHEPKLVGYAEARGGMSGDVRLLVLNDEDDVLIDTGAKRSPRFGVPILKPGAYRVLVHSGATQKLIYASVSLEESAAPSAPVAPPATLAPEPVAPVTMAPVTAAPAKAAPVASATVNPPVKAPAPAKLAPVEATPVKVAKITPAPQPTNPSPVTEPVRPVREDSLVPANARVFIDDNQALGPLFRAELTKRRIPIIVATDASSAPYTVKQALQTDMLTVSLAQVSTGDILFTCTVEKMRDRQSAAEKCAKDLQRSMQR